jgi:hypothetical protein
MRRDTVLALMDLNMVEMYREMARTTPGGWVEERAGLVLCGSPHGSVITNMAMMASPVDAAVVRAETARAFRGAPFSVWTRTHADLALEADLERTGFCEITRTPGMMFAAGDGATVPLPAGADIRPVTDEAGLAAYRHIMTEAYAVYSAPPKSISEKFIRLASVVGPTTQAFLACDQGEPVAGAILYLSHGIGGVGWVGTLPAAFRRGFGAAVTWAVVAEGLRRGVPFLNLQASPMGAPVYRRMGFSTPTHYRVFIAQA